jgi:hypothetical protein
MRKPSDDCVTKRPVRVRLRSRASIFISILAPLLGTPLAGQQTGPSTEGALFLLLPVGAKGVALARGVTALPGPESVWWNPAGLGEVREGRVLVYRGDHPAGEATAASVALAFAPLGTLGLSYQLMDVGTQDVTDSEGNITGTLTTRNHLGVFSAATRLKNRVNLGLNVKVVQFRFTCRGLCPDAGVTTTSLAFDAGAQLTETERIPVRLGAMVAHAGSRFNITGEEQGDPLPTRLRLAAAYELLGHFLETDELKLSLSFELEDRWRDLGSPAKYVGTEFTAGQGDELYLRAGYVFGAEQQLDGASVGVGLHYQRFDLGLAKSLATSALPGDSEPVHISFGLVF